MNVSGHIVRIATDMVTDAGNHEQKGAKKEQKARAKEKAREESTDCRMKNGKEPAS